MYGLLKFKCKLKKCNKEKHFLKTNLQKLFYPITPTAPYQNYINIFDDFAVTSYCSSLSPSGLNSN